MSSLRCPRCGSDRLYRDGFRYRAGRQVQRWLCRSCFYRFVPQVRRRQAAHHNIAEYAEKHPKNSVQVLFLESSNGATEIGPVEKPRKSGPLDVRGKILECAWWLQKQGYSQATIEGRSKLLNILVKRGADLYDPDSVKAVIARQPWCPGRKANAVDAYASFLKMTGGKWEPPFYKKVSKIPFVPGEAEIDQLIAGCSCRMATFLQLLKETGMRPGEAWRLLWTDLDTVAKTVNITPEKGSNPRILPLSNNLATMLESLPKTYGPRVFSRPGMPLDHFRDNLNQQKRRIAHKLQNSRLQRITFKTMRHFKGTLEYHRTKDILYVMQILGHKNIKNTIVYVHLAEQLFRGEQDYVSRVARSQKEACALIAAGFEFVCDWKGHKLFRKRKR